MAKGDDREMFLFGTKAGSLEGYLFHRESVEPLASWVGNISQMYRNLSPGARTEINASLAEVLEKVLSYGERTLEPELRQKLEQLLAEAKG